MLDVAGAGPRGVNKSLLDVAGLLIMRKPGNERAGPKGVNKSLLDVAGAGPRGVHKSLLDVAGVGPKGVMRFALTTTMRSAPSFAPADAAPRALTNRC